MPAKTAWSGKIISVQPRIRLMRSFDQRHHSYLGYVLGLDGQVGAEQRTFLVASGKAAHAKHQFQTGMEVSGEGTPVKDECLETAELYKVSKLKILSESPSGPASPPPRHGVPPALEVYRERGHRRLDPRTYEAKCSTCIWGCRMPVEMIVDQWKPHLKRYRFETFCYGPKSCPLYQAGRLRTVPGRKGMSWEEPDWVDEQETEHRGPDD
jgi:hypothetical protein